MRTLLWIASLVALLVSGCLDDDAASNETPIDEGEEMAAVAPQGFEESGSVAASVSPGPFVADATGGTWCEYGCIEFPFTVNDTANAAVSLTWGLDSNDFDLVLMDAEGNEIATAGASAGVTVEELSAGLEAGDYVIGVVPFAVAADDFTVSVVFS